MYIPSVEEAVKKIGQYYRSEDYDNLIGVKAYLQNTQVATAIAGNGDEFHNATVRLTRMGFYDYAYALAEVGHGRYPRNTDLLGDLLAYGLHCRPLNELEKWYNALGNIPKRFWTWRAYQFSFDYWMERLPEAEGDDQLQEWENKIEGIIKSFQSNFRYLSDKSDCEKAYMIEYEYYNSKGEEEKAEAALIKATTDIQTSNKCAQCALNLADRYFGSGDYGKALEYAEKAVNIKEDQASINLGYTYYILAMSLEWQKRKANALPAGIKPVYSAYFSAYMHLDSDRGNLLDSVKKQVKTLEFEFGISSGIDFAKDTEKEGKLLALLNALQSENDD